MQTARELARERVQIYRLNQIMRPFFMSWDRLPEEEQAAEQRWFWWHRNAARALRDFDRRQKRGRR
ncbi:hypothetical protein [Streptomyces sp. CB03911]|uniref:hypothetical protein n=1 Tax=Streptomyces sp. CB03911 TaxID=1804758 RepID=UPI0009394764|nr:hypothetical protein [Streptomyces sp. CB03911]OKI19296.1 hypothetical protein A6A07_07280 [Streptomyces sp. CB03911]